MNFIDLDSRESKFEKERAQRAEAARKKQIAEDKRRKEHETRQRELEGNLVESKINCRLIVILEYFCLCFGSISSRKCFETSDSGRKGS